MKIAYISAGTGSFYCGTCIRDEALVDGLADLGHEVDLIPLYLPWYAPDAEAQAPHPTFLGGMSVYLRSQFPILTKFPSQMVRAFDRPSLLRWVSRRFSGSEPKELGPMTQDLLLGEDGPHSAEIMRLCLWLKETSKPDVVCFSNALLLSLAKPIREQCAVPVFCTLQGEEGFLDALEEHDQRACLDLLIKHSAHVSTFIAVSQDTQRRMSAKLNIDQDRIEVVSNGIDLSMLAVKDTKIEDRTPAVIGYMARMCPEKGLNQLVRSYIEICESWPQETKSEVPRLLICGTLTPSDKDFVDGLKARIRSVGLETRVDFHPNFSNANKGDLLTQMDLLAVPGPETESFGLYVIEALACGVPVVAPNHAAFPEIVRVAGGGRLYPPGDIDALKETILDLIQSPQERKMLGSEGSEAVHQHFTSARMAGEVSAIFAADKGRLSPSTHFAPEQEQSGAP